MLLNLLFNTIYAFKYTYLYVILFGACIVFHCTNVPYFNQSPTDGQFNFSIFFFYIVCAIMRIPYIYHWVLGQSYF